MSQSEYTIRPSDRLEALINSLRTKDKRGGANILYTWGGHRKYAAACIGGSCGVLDLADSPFIGLTDGALLRPFGAWGGVASEGDSVALDMRVRASVGATCGGSAVDLAKGRGVRRRVLPPIHPSQAGDHLVHSVVWEGLSMHSLRTNLSLCPHGPCDGPECSHPYEKSQWASLLRPRVPGARGLMRLGESVSAPSLKTLYCRCVPDQ